MMFDPYIKKYIPKPCEIIVKNVNTSEVLGMGTLQLTDHINTDRSDFCLSLGDSIVIVLNVKSKVDKQDRELARSLIQI